MGSKEEKSVLERKEELSERCQWHAEELVSVGLTNMPHGWPEEGVGHVDDVSFTSAW